jgi:phospholipase C
LAHDPASGSDPSWQPLPPVAPSGSPIQHVVVVFQENHSFDNVLGKLCVLDQRCDGVTTGKTIDGATVTLSRADDISPDIVHGFRGQVAAIDVGRMDGFSTLGQCGSGSGYACYTQYDPDQIPTYASLARQFVISDATFESNTVASFGAHIDLAAAHLDGFMTGSFTRSGGPHGNGWGCDSGFDTRWFASVFDAAIQEPTCVPLPDGSGPYRPSSVPWTRTIMSRLEAAGLSWRIYAPGKTQGGYSWAICPVFADCLYTDQRQYYVRPKQFALDAAAGTLPAYSVLIPEPADSQHNKRSQLVGENWIAKNVEAVMNGPDWDSTAIFVTYDDCGCFYDHVPPPNGLGIRVPMVIVSPYARSGFTDSNVASYSSILAFVEHTFGLAPLSIEDATAYDYSASFDWSQARLGPIPLPRYAIPAWEWRWMRTHPMDPDDPT